MARRCILLSQAQEQKKLVVAEIREKLEKAQSVVLIDYRGLTVAEVTELRNEFRKAGVEYQVLKNTLIRKAANEMGITGLDNVLEGPTAVAFGMEDPASAAKIISEFAKKTKKTEVKAGLLGYRGAGCQGRTGFGRSAAQGSSGRPHYGQLERSDHQLRRRAVCYTAFAGIRNRCCTQVEGRGVMLFETA